MKKFHITIKDNDTQVVEVDQDTDIIIGSIDCDDSCECISYVSATGKDIILNVKNVLHCARDTIGFDPIFALCIQYILNVMEKEVKEREQGPTN